MAPDAENNDMPSLRQFRRAVELFIEHAYGGRPTEAAERFVPPEQADLRQFLAGAGIERDPPKSSGPGVRSYALRIGNTMYPHMKLRLSRPANGGRYLFTVDSHDGFLAAAPGSADQEALEELKTYNATVAGKIRSAWDAEGIPTERSFLREKITQARQRRADRQS